MPINMVKVHRGLQRPRGIRAVAGCLTGEVRNLMDDYITRKPLYRVSEVQALTGVGKATIRHWESQFREFLAAVRSDGNQRRFSPDAVDKIESIRRLVEDQGLTLKGVRKRLEQIHQDNEEQTGLPDDINAENAETLADLMSEKLIRRLIEDL